MFEAEIVGHTVVLASNLQNKMAFNAYGEVVFMLAQNAVLLALIYRSAPPKAARTAALWGAYFAAVAAHVAGAFCAGLRQRRAQVALALRLRPNSRRATRLQAPCRRPRWRLRTACPTWCFGTRACRRSWPTRPPKTPARSPASPPPCRPRAEQVRVRAAWRGRDLPLACVLGLFPRRTRCAVRILTTIQEGGGRNMLLGYVVGLVLNLILLAQILVYGGGAGGAAGASGRGRGRGPVTAGPRRRSKQA